MYSESTEEPMNAQDWTSLDEFAKAAMQAIMTNESSHKGVGRVSAEKDMLPWQVVAELAYAQAEAMMAEKARREAKEVET